MWWWMKSSGQLATYPVGIMAPLYVLQLFKAAAYKTPFVIMLNNVLEILYLEQFKMIMFINTPFKSKCYIRYKLMSERSGVHTFGNTHSTKVYGQIMFTHVQLVVYRNTCFRSKHISASKEQLTKRYWEIK